MMRHLSLGVLIFVAWSIVQPVNTAAQSNTRGVQVSPLRSRPTVAPGESLADSISVKNNESFSVKVSLTVQRFNVSNESYDYVFQNDASTQWIQFPLDKADINANESVELPYVISVPREASPGGYYFSIFTSSEAIDQKGSVRELRRVASLVYMEVSGTTTKQGTILSADVPSVSIDGSFPAYVRVNNTGNTHFDADIRVQVGSDEVAQLTGLILPSTTRLLYDEGTLPFWPGIYNVKIQSSIGGKQATYENRIVHTPIWFMVGVLFAVLALLFWLKKYRPYARRKGE